MSVTQNKKIVGAYLQQVWNERKTEALDHFIHNDYHDHSFVPGVPPNRAGLVLWIDAVSSSFQHRTDIESMVAEGDLVTVRIRFRVKHIGKWRNMEATGKEAEAKGFRQFRLQDGRIAEHWALLDGESIQSSLSAVHQGCALAQQ